MIKNKYVLFFVLCFLNTIFSSYEPKAACEVVDTYLVNTITSLNEVVEIVAKLSIDDSKKITDTIEKIKISQTKIAEYKEILGSELSVELEIIMGWAKQANDMAKSSMDYALVNKIKHALQAASFSEERVAKTLENTEIRAANVARELTERIRLKKNTLLDYSLLSLPYCRRCHWFCRGIFIIKIFNKKQLKIRYSVV